MQMVSAGIRLPSIPLTGRCQCGAVRYRIIAAPIVFYLCHCLECQRQTSSAFGQSLRTSGRDLEIEGVLATATWKADSGMRRQGRFCPTCGVRIVHGVAGEDSLNVKAGTLDDTSWLVPAGHIWTRSRQPFILLDDDDLVYERGPEDGFEALARRWRQLTGL